MEFWAEDHKMDAYTVVSEPIAKNSLSLPAVSTTLASLLRTAFLLGRELRGLQRDAVVGRQTQAGTSPQRTTLTEL